jgi:ADP-heptose:LPS heptosyltransferase
MDFRRIILSRTDSIGDVILTLPMAGILKKIYPSCQIYFLGRSYTKDIAETSDNIDLFIDWNDFENIDTASKIKTFKELNADAIVHVFPQRTIALLARQAKIPLRIGTTGRFYHYRNCNKLVPLSRRYSVLHETQLNLGLIKPLGGKGIYTLDEIKNNYGFAKITPLNTELKRQIVKDKFNLVMHPKSKGSAREWGIGNFSKLIEILPEDKFRIFITGTRDDGVIIKNELINHHSNLIDLTGKLSLKELISFINETDGLVAASTGPLHIAAALGKFTLGLYPPIKPMHPGRWAPIGIKADYLVIEKKCSKCRKSNYCECLESISPETVNNKLLSWIHG